MDALLTTNFRLHFHPLNLQERRILLYTQHRCHPSTPPPGNPIPRA
jgi:hypothetical protein